MKSTPDADYLLTVKARGGKSGNGYLVQMADARNCDAHISLDSPAIVSVEPVETLVDGALYQNVYGAVMYRDGDGWRYPPGGVTLGEVMSPPLTRLVPEGETLRLLDEHQANSFGDKCSCGEPLYRLDSKYTVHGYAAHLRQVAGGAK